MQRKPAGHRSTRRGAASDGSAGTRAAPSARPANTPGTADRGRSARRPVRACHSSSSERPARARSADRPAVPAAPSSSGAARRRSRIAPSRASSNLCRDPGRHRAPGPSMTSNCWLSRSGLPVTSRHTCESDSRIPRSASSPTELMTWRAEHQPADRGGSASHVRDAPGRARGLADHP